MSDKNVIQPTVLYTEAYLNDPIKFSQDSRFVPESAIRLLESQSITYRDTDGAIFVNTNTEKAQHYPIQMLLTVYNRIEFERVIDRNFRQLLQSE